MMAERFVSYHNFLALRRGLYFSLRCRNFIAAFLFTLLVALLLPLVSAALFPWITWFYGGSSSYAAAEFGPSFNAGSFN